MRRVVPELGEVVVLGAERLRERRLHVAEPRSARWERPPRRSRPAPASRKGGLRSPRAAGPMPRRRCSSRSPRSACGRSGRTRRPRSARSPAASRCARTARSRPRRSARARGACCPGRRAHLGLLLEDRPHQVRVGAVERDDLLELVEDEHGAPLALGGDLARKCEQRLDRVVDRRALPAAVEDKPKAPVDRIDLHRRRDAETAEEPRRLLDRLPGGSLEIAVDRLREGGREALLRRRPHQVAVADEDPLRIARCAARSTSDDLP